VLSCAFRTHLGVPPNSSASSGDSERDRERGVRCGLPLPCGDSPPAKSNGDLSPQEVAPKGEPGGRGEPPLVADSEPDELTLGTGDEPSTGAPPPGGLLVAALNCENTRFALP
jgi:hypothetical protein